MRGIGTIHCLVPWDVSLRSGRDDSQASFPSSPESKLQHSLLCSAAAVMHEITSCGHEKCRCFLVYAFTCTYLESLHKCLQSNACLQSMYLCQSTCRRWCDLLMAPYKSAHSPYSTADWKHDTNLNYLFIKPVAWKCTSPFFPFFLPHPVKNVSRS